MLASIDELKGVCGLLAQIDVLLDVFGRKNMAGFRSGRLTVLCRSNQKVKKNKNKASFKWFCICDCGSTCVVDRDQLLRGQQSCGCFREEMLRAIAISSGREMCSCGAEIELAQATSDWYRGPRTCWNCYRKKANERHAKDSEELRDSFIRSRLASSIVKRSGLKKRGVVSTLIPPELIDAERGLMKVKRLLKGDRA